MTKQDPQTIIDTSQDHTFNKPSGKKQHPRTLEQKYTFIWKPDKPDTRDYKYQISNKLDTQFVDLRNLCTPVEDQGNLGSCTAQATASAIELLNNRNNKYKDISRLFIYYYNRVAINTVNTDSGAYIRDSIKTVSKQGAPLETLWPYDISKFRIKPNNIAINDGFKRQVKLYERINNHEGCLDALNNGYPVIVGFYVYSSFVTRNVARTGIMPYPDVSKERFLGGHAVLLVGYNKQQGRYIVRNSWGSNWGERGYFYMPFQVIQNENMSSDFWTIKSVNNP